MAAAVPAAGRDPLPMPAAHRCRCDFIGGEISSCHKKVGKDGGRGNGASLKSGVSHELATLAQSCLPNGCRPDGTLATESGKSIALKVFSPVRVWAPRIRRVSRMPVIGAVAMRFRVLESRYIFPQQFRVSVAFSRKKASISPATRVVGHVCEMAGHVHEHNTVGEYAAIPRTAEHRNIFRALLAQFCE